MVPTSNPLPALAPPSPPRIPCLFLDDRDRPASRRSSCSSLNAVATLDRACLRSTLLRLRTGSCSGLKVSRPSIARDQIVDNVTAAIEGAMAQVPKRWANVRSLHVRAVNSAALPIYQAVPELGLKIEVAVPRMPPHKEDEIEQDVEEPITEGEVVEGQEKPETTKNYMREDTLKKGRRIHEVQ